MGAGLSESCGGMSLTGTSKEILQQVERLEARIAKADLEIQQCVLAGASDPAAKQRAMQLMRRKKNFQEQRQQLLGAQFNVDNLADQEEQARFTLKAVSAMQTGRDRIKASQAHMKTSQVDKILDDVEDLTDEMKAINEAMAQGSGLMELESEYAELQREMLAGQSALPAQRQSAPYAQSEYGHAYGPPQSSPAYRADASQLPPPPPPPQRGASRKASHSVDDEYANAWAATALQAAMAPYAHLPGAGPNRQAANRSAEQWNQRIPVAA